MTQLILKNNGEIVSYHKSGSSLFVDGVYVSPAHAGWSYGGYTLEAAPPTEPDVTPHTPPTDAEVLASLEPVSHAQIIAALILSGVITEQDGIGWISGTLPDAVDAAISTIPPEMQVIARLRAIRPTEVIPTDPIVATLATAEGKTTADLVSLFQLAASL